jgi:ribonuclease R
LPTPPKKTKTIANLASAILQILATQNRPLSKREIARHLHIKGTQARVTLKELLAELTRDGKILHQRHLYLLPPTTTQPFTRGQFLPLTLTHIDEDGRIMGQAPNQELVLHLHTKRLHRHLVPGMQVLGKITGRGEGDVWTAEIIRCLEKPTRTVIGLFSKQAQGGGGLLIPCERQQGPDGSRRLSPQEADKLNDGDVVVYTAARDGKVKIIERLSNKDDPRLFSRMAIHTHDIPSIFPKQALDEAATGTVPPLENRQDLRHIDFVTIDGEDARDFDDAVWATPDTDPKNPHGWRLWVAVADVAYYVKPGSELDHEAYTRGNSVYFPDRVVPMLPEALSNELCSLKPNVDRACMAVEMIVTDQGKMRSSHFHRGLMRSRARLTYTQVQDAIDGKPDQLTTPLLTHIIQPLYAAFHCLNKEREHRGTLELNIAERQIVFDAQGRVSAIAPRPRLDSHRLIEEFMIVANVAAARTLGAKDYPCLYRIHDTPDHIRVANLRDLLKKLSHTFAKTIAPTPHHFNALLSQTLQTPHQRLVHDLVLRTQAQARYNPINIGHYGLGLKHYCHFTSPIRRYADLIVHRALIEALSLGNDNDRPVLSQRTHLTRIGDHISQTERTAATAEREVFKRFAATSLLSAINQTLPAIIVGVTLSGIFVEINSSGAEGFIPKAAFPGHLLFDPLRHCLYSRKGSLNFQLGQTIRVMILEINSLIPEIRLRLVL